MLNTWIMEPENKNTCDILLTSYFGLENPKWGLKLILIWHMYTLYTCVQDKVSVICINKQTFFYTLQYSRSLMLLVSLYVKLLKLAQTIRTMPCPLEKSRCDIDI